MACRVQLSSNVDSLLLLAFQHPLLLLRARSLCLLSLLSFLLSLQVLLQLLSLSLLLLIRLLLLLLQLMGWLT